MTSRALIVAVLCSFFLVLTSQAIFAEKTDVSESALEKEVQALLMSDEIVLRRNIDKLYLFCS